MGEPVPADLLDQPAASVPAGFIPITPDSLENKFFHTPSPSENRYVHVRPSRGPYFLVDAANTTGDKEHLMSCHPSKMLGELLDDQGRRKFSFPSGVHPPGLDKETRAESVAAGIRTSRSRSTNRDILTLQQIQEALPTNVFDEQRGQLSDFELGIKALGMRVNLFDNLKAGFKHTMVHCKILDPPRTEFLLETWHATWPEKTKDFYRRSFPVFSTETAKMLFEKHDDHTVTPAQWHILLNETIKSSFNPPEEFTPLPEQWPKGILPFKFRRSFVSASLMETPTSLKKGGCPISGDAVNVWTRFQQVKGDPDKQPVRSARQDFSVPNLPPNCGVQVHPQSNDLRLVNKDVGHCDPKRDFPQRYQPYADGFDEIQVTDLSGLSNISVPLTREPARRVFEIPPAVLAAFDTTLATDVIDTPVPGGKGGLIGNEFEVAHRLKDNDGRIWDIYSKNEKFNFSTIIEKNGTKKEPLSLGVLQNYHGKPWIFLRSKQNNNYWREASAEEFASGKLFQILKEQVTMRDNREWVRENDGVPYPVQFPTDTGIPFVQPAQPQPPAQQQQHAPIAPPAAAVLPKAAGTPAPAPVAKADPATPSPNLYFRRTSRYIFVDTKRIFDEFDDVSDFSELTQTIPVQKEDSQPVSTNVRSREGARSRSPRGGDPQRLRPPPDMAARAKSAVRTPPHSGPGTKPKFPSPPPPRKGDSPRDKKGKDNSPKGQTGKGRDDSPKGKFDQGKGAFPQEKGYEKGKGKPPMAPVVDPAALSFRGQLQPPPRAPFGQGSGNFNMPTGLASSGGFPVASMGVTFDTSSMPTANDFRNIFAGKGGSQFGPPVGWRPPPGTLGGFPQRPIPPPGPPPGVLPQTNVLGSQFSAGSVVPGVRPLFSSSGQFSQGPPPASGSSVGNVQWSISGQSFSGSGNMFVSPTLSDTTTQHALTTPPQVRDQGLLAFDAMSDSDGSRVLPSPALNPSQPSPGVFPARPSGGNLIVLGSGNSASGPSFAANIPPYKNPPPPPAPPPKPKPPPTPGGFPFGAVDPRDRASQQ